MQLCPIARPPGRTPARMIAAGGPCPTRVARHAFVPVRLAQSAVLLLITVLASHSATAAAAPSPDPDQVYLKEIRPLLRDHCFSCHGQQRKRAGLSLESYEDRASLQSDRDLWAEVIRRIRTGEMPPEGNPQFAAADKERVLGWVQAELFPVDCDNPDPGRVTIRRLNRAEYNNTIRDLLGVNFKPADDFPADDTGYGFDNIGDVLSVTPLLLERYLAAAETILDQAILDPQSVPVPIARFTGNQIRHEDGRRADPEFAALPSNGEVLVRHTVPAAGEYRLSVRAFAQQAGPEPARMALRLNRDTLTNVEVKAVLEAPATYQVTVRLPAGEHRFAAAFLNDYYQPDNPDPNQRDRNLFVEVIEVAGPLDAPAPAPPASHRRIFTCEEGHEHGAECARSTLARFATRAFRRPVAPEELDRLAALHAAARTQGASFEGATKVALQAVLISPHFLFRGELQADPDNPRQRGPLGDYELASRLSYFLWSSMPDDELFSLAKAGRLREQLAPQVHRMLRDPKARALVENFAGQWLQTRNLRLVAPDAKVFPGFDAALAQAMETETLLFFSHIMSEDRSVLDFLAGEYTFVNERLARHYGLAEVQGAEFQRVSLSGTGRAGVLTHGSVLTVTSNPNRTSPVKRGKWVLENLLAQAPPPPPPDVPPLAESAEASAASSLRERMELHRADPTCASCHAQMDPIGFSLEHFDGIGAWRTRDGAFEIDASGQLPSGERFSGAGELSRLLAAERRAQFLDCLAEKMLTYALGRGLEYYDRCAVEKIASALTRHEFRFSALILAVVESAPFQLRRGEGDPLQAGL